jgi:hypothetical protein
MLQARVPIVQRMNGCNVKSPKYGVGQAKSMMPPSLESIARLDLSARGAFHSQQTRGKNGSITFRTAPPRGGDDRNQQATWNNPLHGACH